MYYLGGRFDRRFLYLLKTYKTLSNKQQHRKHVRLLHYSNERYLYFSVEPVVSAEERY